MKRILPILGLLMVVLVLVTGSQAHAAEAIESPQAVAVFDGLAEEGDREPAESGKVLGHHQLGGCHGHCSAVLAAYAPVGVHLAIIEPASPGRPELQWGNGPEAALRPPIA